MKTIEFKACYEEKRVTNSSRDEARENRAQYVRAEQSPDRLYHDWFWIT